MNAEASHRRRMLSPVRSRASWVARDLDQDTLDRRRRVPGDDHPDTLRSASNLANDLRQLGETDDHS